MMRHFGVIGFVPRLECTPSVLIFVCNRQAHDSKDHPRLFRGAKIALPALYPRSPYPNDDTTTQTLRSRASRASKDRIG